MNKLVLVGAGGHCKSVLEVLSDLNDFDIVGILDPIVPVGTKVLNCTVIGDDSLLDTLKSDGIDYAFITIGSIENNRIRKNLFEKLLKLGYRIPSIVSKNAIVSRNTIIENGVFIGSGVLVNIDVSIGFGSIINTGAIIEHEASVGEYTHIATGATLCGAVKVGNETHIGASATVIQGITIGNNVLIGAGSVVVNSIENNLVAYGNPCRVVKPRS